MFIIDESCYKLVLDESNFSIQPLCSKLLIFVTEGETTQCRGQSLYIQLMDVIRSRNGNQHSRKSSGTCRRCLCLCVLANDIIFPVVNGNYFFVCDAAWRQVVLHTVEHIANQKLCCALSDHMTSSKT